MIDAAKIVEQHNEHFAEQERLQREEAAKIPSAPYPLQDKVPTYPLRK